MKLNGWRRLAIVLSCIWVISIILLATHEVLSHRDGFFAGLTLPEGTVIKGHTATLPDGRTVELNMKLEGRDIKPWEIKWDDEPAIPTDVVIYWNKIIAGISIPVVFWLASEFLVIIIAWITIGFRNQKSR